MIIKVKKMRDGKWYWVAYRKASTTTLWVSYWAYCDSERANNAADRHKDRLIGMGVTEPIEVIKSSYAIPLKTYTPRQKARFVRARTFVRRKKKLPLDQLNEFGFVIVRKDRRDRGIEKLHVVDTSLKVNSLH